MQKLLSPILILMLILGGSSLNPGHARAGNEGQATKINEAFENFRYRLSVMPTFTPSDREQAAEALKQDLERLTNDGIPAWTILEHLKQEMLDRETREDFGFWLGSIDPDSITPEQAADLASKFMEKRHPEGAQFAGGGKPNQRLIWIVAGILAAGVVTWLWIRHCRAGDDRTITLTRTETQTSTQTNTLVNTQTQTLTQTLTQTFTETVTQTDFGYCCNKNTGNTVSASPTGCANGQALYWVPSPELCVEID
jgi:hypothetical protein